MGMNKQFKVSFNVTATMSDEQEQAFMAALVDLQKLGGEPHVARVLERAVYEGPEAAFAQLVKQGLREAVKSLSRENIGSDVCGLKFSPAFVEVAR